MELTKCRARMTVFWPMMNQDITKKLLSCSVCSSTREHQQKEPLLPQPDQVLPWSTDATDVFEEQGKQVLLDSYSGWFEVDLLCTVLSTAVISKLKRHFQCMGHLTPLSLIMQDTTQAGNPRCLPRSGTEP